MIYNSKILMNITISLNCDSKCRHCYIKSLDDDSSVDLSIDTWKKILLQFKEKGGEEISIHGGEPLMYEGIGDLLIYASEIGLSTSIITNTWYLNDSLINDLKKSNTYVLVSLDGPRENYMIFRGEDKLDTVINNIDRMLKAGITVHPIFVVHKKNISNISWLVDFALKRDIKTVTLSPMQPIGRANEQNEFYITPENITSLINNMEDLNDKYNGNTRFVSQSLYRPNDTERYLNSKEFLLNYNNDICNVKNDGTIIADFDLPNRDNYVIGSVLDLNKINNEAQIRYVELLNRAYVRGLRELKKGNSINFIEVIQNQALDEMT
ncbi:radical SAM protein [Mycoplasmatota bacterium]|nr:radical SAM protein [Mycoplasmatota bacterium]